MPPNPDSLSPVSAFIKKDIERLIQTFRWNDKTVKGAAPTETGATTWYWPATKEVRQFGELFRVPKAPEAAA